AASNSKARTSSGASTPFARSLRTRAWRMRTSISPCASGATFSIMVVSEVGRSRRSKVGEPLARRPLKIAVQLLEYPAQTVKLIDEVENDVDTFVIDSEVGLQ